MAGAELRVLVPSDGSALEKEARTVLTSVPDILWSRSEDSAMLQARFSFEIGEALNDLLRRLVDVGVGIHARSSISVWPSSLLLRGSRSRNDSVVAADANSNSNSGGSHIPSATEHAITTANVQASGAKVEIACDPNGVEVGGHDARDPPGGWYDFLGTAAERLAMSRAVHAAEADARLSFDFLCLLFIAAFLAALGLVENSTEILVASMLISPLMGPIMAFTLGTLARERRLQRRGVRVELLGLLGCLVLGFGFGLCACGVAGGVPALWPTREMSSRGQLHAVWVGVLVALLSGVAVALATLGGYTASLVGVAISSAVLPPAVNAGLLWSLACVTLLPGQFDGESSGTVPSETGPSRNETVDSPRPNPADLALQGGLSVCLTVLNIICIFLAAVLVLKIKHVTPWTKKRELRSDVPRWVTEERASASPPNFWVPARAAALGRRNSLLLPPSVTATELLTVYSSSTRTWSPGVGVPRPSLKELWGTHRMTPRCHGTSSVVSANATAQQLPPLSPSAQHQLPPLIPCHQIFSAPESRRLVSSAITLPPIQEVGRSPSPPLLSRPSSPTSLLPRFVVTPAIHDPLLDTP